MSPVALPIVTLVALAIFGWTLYGRWRLLRAARPAARFDRLGERAKNALVYAFGQKKFLTGEQPAGLMHFVIFWGFVILGIQVVTIFGRAFDQDFYPPLFAPDQLLGKPFYLLRDVLEALVLVAVSYALYRRTIAHVPRLFGFRPAEERYARAPHWEGIVILLFIAGIMVGGLLHDAGRMVELDGVDPLIDDERAFSPVTGLVAGALGGLSPDGAHAVSTIGFWMHDLIVLTFLNLLPLSKHFHIITAVPNVFFGKLQPKSVPRPLDVVKREPAFIAALDGARQGSGQVASIADVNWKQVLDAFSCTECGRCTSACPATASGSPLAPRQFILDLRDSLYEHGTNGNGDGDRIVSNEVLWSCTTCMACVEACPVGIEHVPAIVEMRRHLVDQGELEPMLQDTLQNFAQQGNSYGKSSRMRARWTKGLDFKVPDARKEPVEFLWFVGDFASFDERAQLASQRVARILHRAGISFGILYEGERNAGNDVRRIGEEGLFEMLVEQNMEELSGVECEAIFTTDPHSLNTLRNEYPEFGLDKPVYHYTELLTHLIREGRIRVDSPLAGVTVTYHDPCYLARYNRITDAPRELMRAIGVELREMPRHGTNTFCCGAGGGRIWMDDSGLAERPSEQRIREAQALGGVDYFVVTCPKDLAMYSDAAKTVGADLEVLEVTALLERAIGDLPETEAKSEPAAGAPA